MEKGSFESLWERQLDFQEELNNFVPTFLPCDMPEMFRDQVCLMTEEFGELAKADKRCRNFVGSDSEVGRTNEDIISDKLEEIADVFIVAMNLTTYSGFDLPEVLEAISHKIKRNEKKLLESKSDKENNKECNNICDGVCCYDCECACDMGDEYFKDLCDSCRGCEAPVPGTIHCLEYRPLDKLYEVSK